MRNRLVRRARTVLAATMFGGILVQPTWAGERDAVRPTVRVTIEDRGDWFGKDLARAQSIVTDLYDQAGVTLLWVESGEAASDGAVLHVIVEKRGGVPRALAAEAMGVAPTAGDGTRGRLAYVLSDQVAAFAEANRLSTASVLGCAMAHELGHLLLPVNSHTADGLMRANWNPSMFPPRAAGLPGFVPQQARLLRLRALGR